MIIELLPDIEFSRCIAKLYVRSLSYDVIKYMVNRIENEIPNEKQFGMTTNCPLLTDEMIDYLCEHFPKGLSLSIDGDKETHELHRKCIQGNITYDLIFSNALKLLKKIARYVLE